MATPEAEVQDKQFVAIVFGIAAAAPFIETLVYDAHVGPGIRFLGWSAYAQVVPLCLILIALRALTFLLEPSLLGPLAQQLQRRAQRAHRELRRKAIQLLYLLPLLRIGISSGWPVYPCRIVPLCQLAAGRAPVTFMCSDKVTGTDSAI